MLTINEFIQQMGGQGVAKPNRYWVTFSLPAGISDGQFTNASVRQDSTQGNISAANTQMNSGSSLSMKCVQMQMPSRTLNTIENRHWGTPYKLPYSAQYDEANFTFVASADLRERNFFEIWQEAVINVSLNSLNFYDEYIAQVKMIQLNHNNEFTYGVELDQCYPINIGAVDYSYSQNNDTVAVTISLAYRRWRNLSSFNFGSVR